ncbi:hypothetical protein T08_2426, partial [Trichinella sp. T8]
MFVTSCGSLMHANSSTYFISQAIDRKFAINVKFIPVDEQQEYQEGSAINRIQSDETSISSPSRSISSTTHNVRDYVES